MNRPFRIRPYQKADRAGVRDVSVRTAWLGGPAEALPDREVWADIVTGYATDVESQLLWVVVAEGSERVHGYLAGARDVQAQQRYLLRRAPAMLAKAVLNRQWAQSETRRATRAMVKSLVRGELVVPEKVRVEFPGRLAFTLDEEARGYSLGAQLIMPCLEAMHAAGVRGVHVQSLSLNEAATQFLRRAGFQLVASWPTTAFEFTTPQKVDLLTWARPLVP